MALKEKNPISAQSESAAGLGDSTVLTQDGNVVIKSNSSTHAKDVAMVGLAIALYAVSAWIVVPIGPIPFTLQMFAVPLMMCVLTPKQAISAIFLYVLLGTLGVPVFSGMRGGLGVIFGPTGGFLLGYLVGVSIAVAILWVIRLHVSKVLTSRKTSISPSVVSVIQVASYILAGVVFTVCAYTVGCIQYAYVASVEIGQAFAVSCAPFIIPDLIKIICAAACAKAVNMALGRNFCSTCDNM